MRVPTHIKGFDTLIDGGFPQNSSILLSGTPGTGKTIFALQFLHEGCKHNEKGLYITFEEKVERLTEQANQFSWDINKYREKNMLYMWYIPASNISTSTVENIIQFVKEHNAKRIVIDSLSTLSLNVPSLDTTQHITEHSIRKFIYSFTDKLREVQDAVTLYISQTVDEKSLSRDGVSEFIADGVIHITFEGLGGEFSRHLLVRKMRHTHHDEDIHPIGISSSGITIHSLN